MSIMEISEPHNIIVVRPDESVVLIDFERSLLNADRVMLVEEEDEVRHMFGGRQESGYRGLYIEGLAKPRRLI